MLNLKMKSMSKLCSNCRKELEESYKAFNKLGMPCGSDEFFTYWLPFYLCKWRESDSHLRKLLTLLKEKGMDKIKDLEYEIWSADYHLDMFSAKYRKKIAEIQEKTRKKEEDGLRTHQSGKINESK
jgi:hypothetical protein